MRSSQTPAVQFSIHLNCPEKPAHNRYIKFLILVRTLYPNISKRIKALGRSHPVPALVSPYLDTTTTLAALLFSPTAANQGSKQALHANYTAAIKTAREKTRL